VNATNIVSLVADNVENAGSTLIPIVVGLMLIGVVIGYARTWGKRGK